MDKGKKMKMEMELKQRIEVKPTQSRAKKEKNSRTNGQDTSSKLCEQLSPELLLLSN